MEIRHLITFLKIIELKSYTAAAVELGYTQSTITTHMQTLEQQVGGKLMSYNNRSLQLSELGTELIPLAEELIETYEKINNLQHNEHYSEVLKVAAPESLTIAALGPIMQTFTARHPKVRLILTNGTCHENQKDLLEGRVDVALMLFPAFEAKRCIHQVLREEKIVIVGNPLMPNQFKSIQENPSTFIYVSNEEGCSYRVMFEKYLEKYELDSIQTMELWSIGAIKEMVTNGLGFAVLPFRTVANEIADGKLKIIQHEETFEPIYSHILVKQKKYESPIVLDFLQLVRERLMEKSIE